MDQEQNSALLNLSPVPCPRLVLYHINQNHRLGRTSTSALSFLGRPPVLQSAPRLSTSSAAHSYQVNSTTTKPSASMVYHSLNDDQSFSWSCLQTQTAAVKMSVSSGYKYIYIHFKNTGRCEPAVFHSSKGSICI